MAGKKGGRSFWGIGASVHIKKNTAGTSNEISLSVLDGLKSQADSELGEADPKVKLGDLSLFTVSSKKNRRLPAKERSCRRFLRLRRRPLLRKRSLPRRRRRVRPSVLRRRALRARGSLPARSAIAKGRCAIPKGDQA